MAEKVQEEGKGHFSERRIGRGRSYTINWVTPSAQESCGVILTPSSVNISAAFEDLVENGKRCSHGISPLPIHCLLQFPSIH